MSFLQKTFGGLSRSYYIRQFLFGLIFFVYIVGMSYWADSQDGNIDLAKMSVTVGFSLVCQCLYPYSRFVYESIIGYIFGDNVLIVNAILMFLVKFFTMALCWMLAVFISPIGLIYLYFYHSKQEKHQ